MVIDSESAIKAEHQRQGLPYPGRDAGDNLDLLDAGDRNIIRRHLAAGHARGGSRPTGREGDRGCRRLPPAR